MSTFQKAISLLDPKQLKRAKWLVFFMLIGMMLETIGIGSVIPALSLMTNANIAGEYPYLRSVFENLGNPSQETLVMWGMFFLVLIYAIKLLFLALLAWLQADFVFGVQVGLSQKLFAGYLHQPYAFHLERNSAQLIRNVTTEISYFNAGLVAGVTILSESFVLVGIGVLLLYVETVGAIIVIFILGITSYIFHFYTKGRVSDWGKARQFHEGQRIQHLQEGIGGSKVVKILGREAEFLNRYYNHNSASAQMGKHLAILQAIPKLWLELLAVLGLAVLVLTMILQGRAIASFIPVLGLFAAAAFRLMPSVNRILTSIQNLRYSISVINNLYNEVHLLAVDSSVKNTEKISQMHVGLELKRVCFRYSQAKNTALTNIELKIHKGEMVGFIGESGAGKSTLIDVILGLLQPTSGCVCVDEIEIGENLRSWQSQIGYVPQHIYLTDDTLRNNVAFGIPETEIDDRLVAAAIEQSQLSAFINTLPDRLDTLVGENGIRLSGGQRQRIGIARALYNKPQIMVFDEATSALDVETEEAVMEVVNDLRQEKTILIIAHRFSTVSQCDRLFRLENGHIVGHGTYSEIMNAAKGDEVSATHDAKEINNGK